MIKKMFFNTLYVVSVFAIAFFIAGTALVRKVNSYQSIQKPLFIQVDKQDLVITNAAAGRLEEVLVQEGDYVEEGTLLARMVDESVAAQLAALEAEGVNNSSARAEARVLRSRMEAYEVKAPRDGVVYRVHLAEGSYVSSASPLITMYGEGDTALYTEVNEEQYNELKSEKELLAYSPRLEQSFPLSIGGVSKASIDPDTKSRVYELRFTFVNPDDALVFLEGETLEVSKKAATSELKRPADLVVDAVRALLGEVN